MPTRQTSSSGRPKSPRIQVVLPEELCQRLALLAEDESRTVSNMAKVLIQQGVERLERLRLQGAGSGVAPADGVSPAPAPPAPVDASSPVNAGLLPAAATAPPPAVSPPTASSSSGRSSTASPPFAPPPSTPPAAANAPTPAPPPSAARPGVEGSGSGPVPGSDAAADRFRAELERHEAQGPRRLRGVPRRLRLRPPGGA